MSTESPLPYASEHLLERFRLIGVILSTDIRKTIYGIKNGSDEDSICT